MVDNNNINDDSTSQPKHRKASDMLGWFYRNIIDPVLGWGVIFGLAALYYVFVL